MCTSNNGRKGDEDAAGVQEVGSEVRLRLRRKPLLQSWVQQGSPPLPAQRLLRAAPCAPQVRKTLGEDGLNAMEVGV